MIQQLPPTSPDDESLKHAIHSAWGHQTAPEALRRRVQMAMTRTVLEEPEIPATTRSRRFWDRWPTPVRIAAGIAALLVLTVGTTWGILLYQDAADASARYARSKPDFIAPTPSPTLYAMLVSRHEDFAAGAEADPTEERPAADQLATIRTSLASRLHHAVWVPDLTKLGWRLDAVRVYPINGVSAVAFNFSRGNDEISAFSLPVLSLNAGCDGPLADLDLLVDNRSFSSFSSEGQLFALVGSRGCAAFPQADLRALVNRFRVDPACTASACATTQPTP
jgi:hypothetical protein